jgi:glutamate:Na+ symporter, ESS family
MTPERIAFAVILLGVILVAAKVLRARWGLAQRLFLPASILGGFIALVLSAQVLGAIVTATVGEEAWLAAGLFGEETMAVWEELPELLITVVFATLFLGQPIPHPRTIWQRGGPQISLGVTLGAGQYVVGILLTVLLLTPLFGISPMAGALIEIGFEGGHGTAAGMRESMENLGFPEGADLALGMATIGVVSGVVIGMILINWGVRRDRTAYLKDRADASEIERSGFVPMESR